MAAELRTEQQAAHPPHEVIRMETGLERSRAAWVLCSFCCLSPTLCPPSGWDTTDSAEARRMLLRCVPNDLISGANVASTCLSSASLSLPGPHLPQEFPCRGQSRKRMLQSLERCPAKSRSPVPKGPEGCVLAGSKEVRLQPSLRPYGVSQY